jgi:hypothetical protein
MQNQPVRIIKRDQRGIASDSAQPTARTGGVRAAERELRAVVKGWIHEHRQSVEQLQRMSLPFALQ